MKACVTEDWSQSPRPFVHLTRFPLPALPFPSTRRRLLPPPPLLTVCTQLLVNGITVTGESEELCA